MFRSVEGDGIALVAHQLWRPDASDLLAMAPAVGLISWQTALLSS